MSQQQQQLKSHPNHPFGSNNLCQSSAVLGNTATSNKNNQTHKVITLGADESKKPNFDAAEIMNEDQQRIGNETSQPPSTNAQKQSFLSKFARSEVKSSKSIDKSTNKSSDFNNCGSNSTNKASSSNNNDQRNSTMTTTSNKPVLEIDSDKNLPKSTKVRGGLGGNLFPNRASKSFCENDTCGNDLNKSLVTGTTMQKPPQQRMHDNVGSKNNQADDDNDQVLPVWPSKIDTTTLEPSMFQVYSLKDYSQVSGPTENVTSSTAGGRLLKSMSQDRKVDSRTKRMSECILPSAGQTSGDSKSTNQARQQRLPSMIGKMSTANLRTMGPATSVNSLLPQNKNPNLISESRIDRMRKLFVSPLSLRGSTGGNSSQAHQASSHSRLSLQAGANMLNKPHHLMHAMYRTRVGVGAHYSRRSPMRQKPGAVRGFRVYGCPLNMANTMYPITCFGRPDIYKQQSVPYILARLCYYIEENSSELTHEGIFRVSGNARLMEKLKTLFDHLGDAPLESESVDVATSASMLKMYLRELPDPLIPTRMNYYFFTLAKKYSTLLSKSSFDGFRASDNINTTTVSLVNEASSISDGQSTLDRQKIAFIRDLTKLIRKLPIENYNLLKYLACFLHRISLKQKSNKMSAEALGIVFGPNVFRIRSESYKGLKEQELSNQIMASIITNYKQIFDCELTDALGNLVKSDEFLHLSREREDIETRERALQTIKLDNIDRGTSLSRAPKKDTLNSPPIPTTSAAFGTVQKARCSRHGRHHVGYQYSDDESDDEDANIDADDDGENFDDEECDDGSYSRTSDSGSYCSSMASDSVESIYEGDVDGEQYDEEDDEFALGSNSSSECGSETSYTPSSSHSETNANEVELSSSNFSSNHSLAEIDVNDNETNIAQPQKSCIVCKRRESAQIEANKMREQIRVPILHTPDEKKSYNEITDSKKRDSITLNAPPVSTAEEVGGEQNQVTSVKNSARLSTRRKRVNDDTKKATITKSDITLTTKDATVSCQTVRSNRHNNHQTKPDQRHGALRRRSSSASSLLRISNNLHHASRKRSAGREDYHAHRDKNHPGRRKCNDPRAYNRRSRNKEHLVRKDGHGNRLFNNRTQQAFTNKAHSSKTHSEWKKGDCYVPELIAMNFSPETKEELVWNYVSSSFIDMPECDRFYQLRSYNSDETLMSSLHNSNETTSRTRRRFSEQDYLNPNQENLLAKVNSEFQKIAESYEDEAMNDKADDIEEVLNEPRRIDLSVIASEVQSSSVVSLLDDQMVSFKHSTLSLNEDTSDPIVGQLKVIKDLIRTLEKMIRDSKWKGFDQESYSYLFQLAKDAESSDQIDSIASCCFDYLAAKSVIIMIDSLKRDNVEWPKIDMVAQERLVDLLTAKIADLKKRYSNLKYIREHYYKHHTKSRQPTEGTVNIADIEQSKDGDKLSSKLDGQSACSDISSIGSIISTTGPEQSVKVIQSDKQPTDTTLTTSSCKFGSLCPVEFVFNMEKQLASRRRSGSRLVRLNDMTLAQLQSEKLELQKNLLRYEHWFGRPTTRSEFNLIGHLYERYRAVKIIKQQKQVSS